jgi:hypothetical protein
MRTMKFPHLYRRPDLAFDAPIARCRHSREARFPIQANEMNMQTEVGAVAFEGEACKLGEDHALQAKLLGVVQDEESTLFAREAIA